MQKPIPAKAARKQADLCMDIVSRTDREVALGIPADRTVARFYRQHREFGSRDRRFFSDLIFSWFRWRGWLAHPKHPRETDLILAHLLDATDVHPAIECLAGRSNWTLLEPLGNCSIAEKAGKISEWLGLPAQPGCERLVPAWSRECLFYPDDAERDAHFLSCIEAWQSRPPIWVRMRKDSATRISRRAAELFNARGALSLPCSLRLQNRADWERLKPHCKNNAEIQDLSSQCVGSLCAPRSGETWWDVCAGAGGKSLHLADMMGSGAILATDIRQRALQECGRRARHSGIHFIKTRAWDGISDPAKDRLFDGVLVDASCSGMGTWHRNPDARWRTTKQNVNERADSQSSLLELAVKKLRPGGRLVYATCTLTNAENVGVVKRFLKNHPACRLMPGPHPLSGEPTNGMTWIWPWQAGSNGMFIAKIALSHSQPQ